MFNKLVIANCFSVLILITVIHAINSSVINPVHDIDSQENGISNVYTSQKVTECIKACDNVTQACSITVSHPSTIERCWAEVKLEQNHVHNLTFNGPEVTDIHEPIHKMFSNLLKFVAVDTSIKAVKDEDFAKLTDLVTLEMMNGELTDICGHAFDDLESLEMLSLASNEIKFLHPELFRNLTKLKSIDLRMNSIDFLHPELFVDLTELTSVNLGFNNLIYIDRQQFKFNYKLQMLTIIFNDLKVIDSLSFINLKLTELNLNENPCTINLVYEFDDNFLNMTEIRKFLDANCMGIGKIRDEVEARVTNSNRWFRKKSYQEKCGGDSYFMAFYYSMTGGGSGRITMVPLLVVIMAGIIKIF